MWGTELPVFSCNISHILQYLSFASPLLLGCTHTAQVLYRDITAPWLSFETAQVPAEKYAPRCHMWQTFSLRSQSNSLTRVSRQCILPQALQIRRDKVTCLCLSPQVQCPPAPHSGTVSNGHGQEQGVLGPRCARYTTDKSWASLYWIPLLLGCCSFLSSGLTCLPSSAFTSGLRGVTH